MISTREEYLAAMDRYKVLDQLAFTDKTSYLTWRATWRAEYKALSMQLRNIRLELRKPHAQTHYTVGGKCVKDVYGKSYETHTIDGVPASSLMGERFSLRIRASCYLEMRKRSKLKAQEQWRAARCPIIEHPANLGWEVSPGTGDVGPIAN